MLIKTERDRQTDRQREIERERERKRQRERERGIETKKFTYNVRSSETFFL